MFRFALLLIGLSWTATGFGQTIGNVWHLPRNIEPVGVAGMRNPPYGILTNIPVTLYNGSYTLDGNQMGGFVWHRVRGSGAPFTTADMTFDSQSGNNKYWRATLPAAFRAGDTVEYFFEIVFTDRATTYIYGTDTSSQRTISQSQAATNAFTFRVTLPWPGGNSGGYPSDPPERVWHWKEEAVVGNGYITAQIDQNGTLYDIYYPSAGNRQGVSTANEGYRGPEEFPSCPGLTKQANGQMNVIAGMGGIGIGTNEIFWLKNTNGADYTDNTQRYVTNNNVVFTSARLTRSGYNIRVDQHDFCPVPAALPVVSGGGRTNYGVYLKRFLLTNLEGAARTVQFYYDVNFNVNGGNDNDVMTFDTSSNRNTMIAYDRTYRTVAAAGSCGPNGTGTEYKPASYAGDYVKDISLYFGTAMKLVTNVVTGAGSPADGAWRDHTFADNQEGWIAKLVTIPAGETVEIDVLIVGSWDDSAGQTGTHNFWGRPIVDWFYTNHIAEAQAATEAYWSNWLASGVTVDFPDDRLDALWNRSLLVSALHVDAASGSILAGMHNGAYPFVWPRDGIYAAMTFARTGHTNESHNFYRWLRDTASRDIDSGIGDKGFFYQKYTTDGHRVWTAPQVDETASVPWGLYQHYLITGHGGFLSNFWNLAYTCARASSEDSTIDSRLNYNDTYNLVDGMSCWEDAFGLFLYSNGSVVRGLRDAANIATLVGQNGWASTFNTRANAIKGGIDARIDARVEPADISHLGLVFPYEVYSPADARMTNMIEWLHGRQSSGGFTDNLVEPSAPVAGLLRRYNHNVNNAVDNYWNGGPWFLATAWYGEYYARWQDYRPGKAFIDVSRDKLNLLLDKLGPNGLGAEQIAPHTGAQKYPGFWLQTAWPNVWESHSTLIDQMMLFLDFQPTTSNTVMLSPKLPTGWTNMTYRNLQYRNHRFDATVSETPTSTRLEINKLTGLWLGVDVWLRILPGQVPAMIAINTNHFSPSMLFNTNLGRARITYPLSAGLGTNVIAVTFGNSDFDGDGLPDSWEIANGLDPLNASGANGASGDPDGDGFDNYSEFIAGTNPRNAASLLRIAATTATGRIITWASVAGVRYQILTATNVPATFAPLSGELTATNGTMTFTDTNAAGGRRFYRVQVVP
jgi:hypothetical protein